MKKMIILTMSIFLIVSVTAQQWVNFPRPEGLKSANQIVFKGDTIAVFDSAVTYVTTDFGVSWLSSVSPFSFQPSVSRFGEGYYGVRENKIFFSRDLVSWEVSAVLDVESISSLSAGNAIIATAIKNAAAGDFVLLRSTDGIHFTEGHSAVSFSSPVFMGDTIIVMLRSGLPSSPRYRSVDNGFSWSLLDTAMITDLGSDCFNHKYEVVGASGIDTATGFANFQSSGIGEYAFNGFNGSSMTSVAFSSFGCLMTGSQYDQGNAVRSFCVKNGNIDSVTFFESKLLQVFSDHGSLAILSGDNGNEMWIAKRSAYPGGIEERQKYFSVFPNPTTGDVTVVSLSKMEVVLCDANAKILDRYILVSGNNHFNISAFPAGVYFLKSPTSGFVGKILKQ